MLGRLRSFIARDSITSSLGPLELLVLQGTPFCNLDCDYCYLPDRDNHSRMDLSIIKIAVERILEANLVADEFTVVWHAGEPLVLGVDYYELALDVIRKLVPTPVAVHHSFQTNGVLIDDNWCKFFKRKNIRLGLSIDGPAEIHDLHRRTRDGKSTHYRIEQAVDRLKRHGVNFHVIAVLTAESIQQPDIIFEYFNQLGVDLICFNTEEIEGANLSSSLLCSDSSADYFEFLRRLHELRVIKKSRLKIREIDGAIGAIMHWRSGMGPADFQTQENSPFRILNVDANGDFCTFSPELLGLSNDLYGPLKMGNLSDMPIAGCIESAHYQRIARAVNEGVMRCKSECEYFELCGGGSPSNKLAENGCLDSAETKFCRLHKKTCIELGLTILETELEL